MVRSTCAGKIVTILSYGVSYQEQSHQAENSVTGILDIVAFGRFERALLGVNLHA